MVVALNLSQARRDDVLAGTSPLAELMACLHVLAEPDHHPEARNWAERISAQIPDALRPELFRFAPLWARYRFRLFYPLTKQLDLTIDEELDGLADVDDEWFLPLTANGIRGRDAGRGTAHDVLTDRSWVADCERRSFTRGDLAYSLVADPRGFREHLVEILRACRDAFFTEEWEKSRPRLASTATQLNSALHTGELIPIVESLSKIASSRGSQSTVFFDKLQSVSRTVDRSGLLLIPSLRGWPHLMVKADPQLPVVIHFLAQEQSATSKSQSQQDIRMRLLVLAEPGRWELCRHLIGESITTTELSVRTGLSAPAVSRHLRVMREAGLISSQRDGRQVFHRVHSSLILQLGQDVLSAIIR